MKIIVWNIKKSTYYSFDVYSCLKLFGGFVVLNMVKKNEQNAKWYIW